MKNINLSFEEVTDYFINKMPITTKLAAIERFNAFDRFIGICMEYIDKAQKGEQVELKMQPSMIKGATEFSYWLLTMYLSDEIEDIETFVNNYLTLEKNICALFKDEPLMQPLQKIISAIENLFQERYCHERLITATEVLLAKYDTLTKTKHENNFNSEYLKYLLKANNSED